MAQTDNDIILEKFDAGFLGIIWITENSLKSRPEHFKTMDYLMDGVLTRFLNSDAIKEIQKNLFVGRSFDQSFFLIHMEDKLQNILAECKNLVNLSLKESESRKRYLVVNKSNVRVSKELSKCFPDLEFKTIN